MTVWQLLAGLGAELVVADAMDRRALLAAVDLKARQAAWCGVDGGQRVVADRPTDA